MIRPFGWNEFLIIVMAAQWTIALSAIAFAGGGIGGLLVALARVSDIRPLRILAVGFIRVFQGTPLLMQLFLVFFGMNIFGLAINPWVAASIALTLHASAFLGEIWRGCVEAVPPGQREAATALGLKYFNRMRYIILPQATRIAVAPTVGFLVQLIKGTSLAAIIGFTELTRQGQIINNATFSPFMVFGTVAAIYFVLCWPLSLLARRMEVRFSRSTQR
ncbi:amino acid ABC transporter permease [Pseudorhizobium marinum]|jgi:polar amino acid transport system permease protein|uniref:amino acid ABC transporter permease n=1 Tax=Pseudorhizobium marinum TaxID=1496690 RepID=UPI0004978FF2|nr:amino acid ABC transporter permease [Pseudorhizobium marinum]MBU1315963.1 amino acid ABC transporter permease [Alphaproteobacteria bacterium]MDY6961908.1 amino acid ABC transporter permease [Pseudomonadota bacterium]MBU1549620.1 amino acid ABC transporter permease [Alphaproteobacteria bacterium]MBU2336475.1 amino acid ABC transporter permease [Alphaproteobacteria bacterium]MBU2387644.1 amino acid ABC transporter permease [Alphaproteobacteria bacterium]